MNIAATCGSSKWAQSAFIASAVIISTAPPVHAADLVPVKGEISVNRGTGYHPVRDRTRLTDGDAVIAAPGALGSLIYADGCTIDILPGTVAWVGSTSPCASGVTPAERFPPLSPTKAFKRDWLVGGAASLKRTRIPAGP